MRVGEFIDAFRKYMTTVYDSITILDSEEPGSPHDLDGFLSNNEGPLTDYMVICTIDYLYRCRTDPDFEFMKNCLQWLKDDVDGIRFWAVRLESVELEDFSVGPKKNPFRPWADYKRWHFIPTGKRYITTNGRDDQLNNVVNEEWILPFKSHKKMKNCASCNARKR